ncbi:MOSC domain-containing protein [Massilia sp. CMS3.1]|uniref:MOSC domain-containing protein n=1 Tax=Massilia sp. CMS3.1 TaxID=3373083 RepID=UPI003EE56463
MTTADIGSVVALASRTLRSAPPESFERLVVRAGVGIDGDIHADALSPRQLLLASSGAYDALRLPPHALHENLLIDADTAQLASGTVLQVGSEVRLRMMFQCEACGQLDVQQSGLARRLGLRRGMLARVLAGGTIRRGDRVRDLGVLEQPWLDDWRERVRCVLDAVPPDAVIEYRHLARLAGIQSSYCRAFPRLLAKLGDGYAAKAVSAQSALPRPRWQGEGLFEGR